MVEYDESNPEKNIDYLLRETFRVAADQFTHRSGCIEGGRTASVAANAYANLLRLRLEMKNGHYPKP